MTKTSSSSSQGSSGSQHIDFDALYRGESPGEGISPVTTPPWDNQAPRESVIGWQTAGWVHGDVLDIGCVKHPGFDAHLIRVTGVLPDLFVERSPEWQTSVEFT